MKNEYSPIDFDKWPLIKEHDALALQLAIASEVGKTLYDAFYQGVKSHVGIDQSEQTTIEEEIEVRAREMIHQNYPNVSIMGEEVKPDEDISGKHFFVIDPVDGTTNWTRGFPICNFTMAEAVDGELKSSIVYDFLHGTTYYAVKDGGAFKDGYPIYVSKRPFRESVICFAPLRDVRKGKGEYEGSLVKALWDGMEDITIQSGRFHREIQSGALELAEVARGIWDGYASSWTNPWDLSGGVLLVKEGGGRATTMLGNDWQPRYKNKPNYWGVIAGNSEVHGAMLPILQEHFEKDLFNRYGVKLADII